MAQPDGLAEVIRELEEWRQNPEGDVLEALIAGFRLMDGRLAQIEEVLARLEGEND